MCRHSPPSALPFLVGTLCLFFARPAYAALPPGYEDVMWCPPGYCRRSVPQEPGFAGPVSVFYECYDPATDEVADGVWTGELTDVAAPEGWVEDPADCLVKMPPSNIIEELRACVGAVEEGETDETKDTIDPQCVQQVLSASVDQSILGQLAQCAGGGSVDGILSCVEGQLANVADGGDGGGDAPTQSPGVEEPEEGQFDDIIAACGAQIGAGIACFTTSQEPACEGFDPMSLLAGDLPIPDNCDEGAELVCAALVGCCDQEIIDIAACAAKTNLGLECDIDCTPDTTSGGGSNGAAAFTLLLATLVGFLGALGYM